MNDLSPDDVTMGSHRQVWWQCQNGHIFLSTVKHRTGGTNCPYCSNQKACLDNCLATVRPDLAAEWHPTKNGKLGPADVLPNSVRKVWWLCPAGHEYECKPNHRYGNHGCPKCDESLGEKAVAAELGRRGIPFRQEVRFDSCRNKRCLPFDFGFYCGEKLGVIEFQGQQHYQPVSFGGADNAAEILQSTQKRDRIKRDWCKAHNIPLLEIPYTDLDKVPILIDHFLLFYFQGS